jgi:DDE superfamily endonuclease
MEKVSPEPIQLRRAPTVYSDDILAIIGGFAVLFSERVWQQAQTMLIGAILTQGKRTVTALLRVMGLSQEQHFTNYHRVLNRASWSALQGSRILLGLIILLLLPPGSPIVLGADDTVERRGGRNIKARGCYRDAVRSTKKVVVKCFGLKWVSMQVLVRVPWSKRVWGLPFLTVLCEPEEKKNKKGKGKRHKSSVDLVRQMGKLVRRWLPERVIVLVLDGAFASVGLALALSGCGIIMITRLRLDARLFNKPGKQEPGKRGPKPKKGTRQRSLKQWAARTDTPWQDLEVNWYGGQRKQLKVFSRTALWYRVGFSPLEIRYVLVRDPEGKLDDSAYFSTDINLTPVQILEYFVMRWNLEVTFEEAREHLGVETQRQWSDNAITRTTPILFALFSIVTLLAFRLSDNGKIAFESTAWYKKREATFSDCISLVRSHLSRVKKLNKSDSQAKFSNLLFEVASPLFDQLPLSA